LSQMASSSINLELHISEDWALAPTAQAERPARERRRGAPLVRATPRVNYY